MKKLYPLVLLLMLITSCKENKATQEAPEEIPTAKEIMQKAHATAGGDFWKRPQSLTLKGYAVFYTDGKARKHEKHHMWRVFETEKANAHTANGKVRIESFYEGQPVFIVSYDGQNTYDLRGKQEQSEADARWASNFGYGAIRHALDDGYALQLMPDDTVKQRPTYTLKVTDPNGGETFFGIDKGDFRIVKVAFETPRGWHHREYSQFFKKEDYDWLQSGRVELFYDGQLSNEVFWTDFEVNETLPDSLFIVKTQS